MNAIENTVEMSTFFQHKYSGSSSLKLKSCLTVFQTMFSLAAYLYKMEEVLALIWSGLIIMIRGKRAI